MRPSCRSHVPGTHATLRALQPVRVVIHPQTDLDYSRVSLIRISAFNNPICCPVALHGAAHSAILQKHYCVVTLSCSGIS